MKLLQDIRSSERKEQKISVQSTVEDTWRAALLLIAVFGGEALDYARAQQNSEEDAEKSEVWERIVCQISEVLTRSPRLGFH